MNYEDFIKKYHLHLTAAQEDAVTSVSGPVCVEASPGSGKTTALVARLGYMIYVCGIRPENILTMTYTVAATHDMKSRFLAVFGPEFENRLEFRTINGVCQRIINDYARMTGKTPFRLLTDEREKNGILADLYRAQTGEYAVESEIRQISGLVTLAKNSFLTDEQLQELGEENRLPLLQICKAYAKELSVRQVYDYDDQLTVAWKLLQKAPQLLSAYRTRYPYINVDESQDNSVVQHRILDLLAGPGGNLFLVGDLDQSIYGFRGAAPEELLSFETRHPGAKIIYMEDNFRSDGKIISLADRFIQKNRLRRKKHVKATRPEKICVEYPRLKKREWQYEFLMRTAVPESRKPGADIAVLYNENESALPLIDLLERNEIPYCLKKSEGVFFQNRVVLDVLNLVRFSLDPANEELFLQIYYKMGTFLTKKQAISLCRYAKAHNLSILPAVRKMTNCPVYVFKACNSANVSLFMAAREPALAALHRIIDGCGYEDYLNKNHISTGKLFILYALAQNCSSLPAFLQRMEELQKIVSADSRREAGLSLSTIHSSKGLEYDTVYLIDVIDGNLPAEVPENPNRIKAEERKIYEEERRKFYVGVTRAKNHLYLLSYKDSYSSFVFECHAFEEKAESCGSVRSVPKKGSELLPPEEPYEKFLEKYAIIGKRVCHKKFGCGTVTDYGEDSITILFDHYSGEKSFISRFCWQTQLLREEESNE